MDKIKYFNLALSTIKLYQDELIKQLEKSNTIY